LASAPRAAQPRPAGSAFSAVCTCAAHAWQWV